MASGRISFGEVEVSGEDELEADGDSLAANISRWARMISFSVGVGVPSPPAIIDAWPNKESKLYRADPYLRSLMMTWVYVFLYQWSRALSMIFTE
jgi:hypothetical protein